MALDLIEHRARLLKTPWAVQKYLMNFSYNHRAELLSAKTSIHKNRAHCLEGVFVAAAILEYHGFEPWCLSFESQDGLDHCLYVFQDKNERWGSIGKSRDRGLHGRPAQFKTLAELVTSYEEPYIDKTGRILAWQVAHLDEINCDWRRSPRNVWAFENHLLKIKHHKHPSSLREYKKIKDRYLKYGEMKPKKNWW